MKSTKSALSKSILALVLCCAMLIGTTFAWFTDSITSGKNIIQSGNLDIEMYWTDDLESGVWYNVEEEAYNTIFNYDNWEPGYTDVKYVKIVNNGSLALNYKLAITPENGVGKLAEVINVYFANSAIPFDDRDDLQNLSAVGLLNNVLNNGTMAEGTLLADGQFSPLHPSGEVVMTFAMSMLTTAGNDYQSKSAGEFTITALATQASFESDSFGSNYDSAATYPKILKPVKLTQSVTPVDGKVPAGGVLMQGSGIEAVLPEGVALEDGVDELTLTITPLEKTTSGVVAVENELLMPVDIHIDGVSEDNDVPIIIDLGSILPTNMNIGNYYLYHMEDGVREDMTLVGSKADLDSHNKFTYDPATGSVSVAMASFSEVTLVANYLSTWEGGVDYSWYKQPAGEKYYLIANADQLYAFSKIVGGMADGIAQDSFAGKKVELITDINLNKGKATVDEKTRIFYPIGYYNNKAGIYDRDDGAEGVEGVVSSVNSFEGIFDGQGHIISNFYQNTWEMFGDYNDGYTGTPNYYKDAMGLFGYVHNGTVQNLTVDRFTSDGEFTPTGVIAAFADGNSKFENIAITNCNPRVYNTGNGGIVGIGGVKDTTSNEKLEFNYITVDNSNTISALWGSWDVACGGLVGMYRGDVVGDTVHFENCHVAAQIDVFNDVCGNYQYYWYRYAGMIIGSMRGRNTTDANGYTVPDMTGVTAGNCTVQFEEWNDYYYCELVANSLASYTHDHQFSRLTEISDLSDIQDEDGNWDTTGNFLLIQDETKTCYHIVSDGNDGFKQHLHKDAGEETVNGETVLKEDKQIVYLPFNQLFQGDGWGVKHIPITGRDENVFSGITVLDRSKSTSVQKFASVYTDGEAIDAGIYTVSEFFEAIDGIDDKISLKNDSHVRVTISKAELESDAGGSFVPHDDDWTMGTITLEGSGLVRITIQDYFYCIPTVLYVEIGTTFEDDWGFID